MPYAILRFEKRRGGPASALEKHHERKKQQYASNPEIDTERSEMNFHLVQLRVKYYGEIQKDCPDWLSLEQFRAVAHISKRKAKWLLENGIIPCEDSGKQTCRFQIRRSDVADFLRRQDTGELNSIIPIGAFNSNNTLDTSPLPNTEPEELLSSLMEEWTDEPDMLTTKQAANLTGYNDTTVNNWVADGKIQAVNYYGKNLISKESLAEYLASVEGQCIVRPSQKHHDLMKFFKDREQNNSMVFGSMSL